MHIRPGKNLPDPGFRRGDGINNANPTDVAMKYFEDFHPGDVFDCGSRVVTQEEIIAFATQFDPQPFHVDVAAAAKSHFATFNRRESPLRN